MAGQRDRREALGELRAAAGPRVPRCRGLIARMGRLLWLLALLGPALLGLGPLAAQASPAEAVGPDAGREAAGLAVSSLPAAPATEYDTLDLDWQDSARERAVPVRLYLPKGSPGAAPLPLLVFSHGLGGSREGYSYLGRYLASHGVAVLHVQHVGSDRSLWAGNRLLLVFRLQSAAQEREAMARVQDLRFALDQLLAAPQWAGRFDSERILVGGHSYGANTAMLASGAQVWREGKPLPLRDERFKALLLLSSPPFYGEGRPEAIVGKVALPSLHITTTEDDITVPGYSSPPSDRVAVFDAMGGAVVGGGAHKALAVFQQGAHSIFTDRIVAGGAALNAQVKQATQELVLDFIQQVFSPQTGEQAGALAGWQARFKPLLARFEQR